MHQQMKPIDWSLNQSSIVDQSLMHYLDEFTSNAALDKRKRSVDEVEPLLQSRGPTQIHRQSKYDSCLPVSPELYSNIGYQQQRINQSTSSQVLNHPQVLTNNSSRSNQHQQQQQRTEKGQQSWMSKYLNAGNEFSRMYGSNLQQSVSPQIDVKKVSKIKTMSHAWNRSSSLERAQQSQTNQPNLMQASVQNFNTLHYQSCAVPSDGNTSYNRSNSHFNRKSKKLNKSMNGIDSSSILQQSMTSSSLINPVVHQSHFGGGNFKMNHYPSGFLGGSGIESVQFSKVDVSFAERIVPLLDGAAFYKKFSSRQSLNENAFDPLNADKFPPEMCGYGIRLFQLDKSLLCINVRMSLKIAVEVTISLNDIVKPILPQTTMDIIRAQKQQLQHGSRRSNSRNSHMNSHHHHSHYNISQKDLLEEFLIFENKGSISHLAKIGIVNKNSELYRQKCLESTFYPFSIALTNGRVELIATSYETLKNWIIGINLLVSNKKHIPKLKQLMELKLE